MKVCIVVALLCRNMVSRGMVHMVDNVIRQLKFVHLIEERFLRNCQSMKPWRRSGRERLITGKRRRICLCNRCSLWCLTKKVAGIRSVWSFSIQICWLTEESAQVNTCGRWSTIKIWSGCISLMSFFVLQGRLWKVIYVTLGYLLRICSNRNRGSSRDRFVSSRLWQTCIVHINSSSL